MTSPKAAKVVWYTQSKYLRPLRKFQPVCLVKNHRRALLVPDNVTTCFQEQREANMWQLHISQGITHCQRRARAVL